WRADRRNFDGDWRETDGTTRWSVCAAHPWCNHSSSGLSGGNYRGYVGGWFVLRLTQTSRNTSSRKNRIIPLHHQGRVFSALFLSLFLYSLNNSSCRTQRQWRFEQRLCWS